jgi:hypothetical protein
VLLWFSSPRDWGRKTAPPETALLIVAGAGSMPAGDSGCRNVQEKFVALERNRVEEVAVNEEQNWRPWRSNNGCVTR